jgi:uncharacterized membrane protein
MQDMLPESQNPPHAVHRDPFPWDRLFLAVVLLGIEGASLGLLWGVVGLPSEVSFFTKNTTTAAERRWMFSLVLGGASAPLFIALGVLLFGGRPGLALLERWSRRLAPVCLLGLVPALFSSSTWGKEPLTYLSFLALVMWLAERLFALSFRYPGVLFSALAARWEALPGRVKWWVPFVVVLCGALWYTTLAGYLSTVLHRKFQTSGFDLGIYDNLMYTAMKGDFFRSPVLFGPKGGNYLAGHAEFVLLLFVPLYAIWPQAEMLLWLQSFLIGMAAVPLYLFASTKLPHPTAMLIALAYLFYAPLHGPNFYDFHWISCAIFFHFFLYYAISRGNLKTAWILVLILFSIREDVAVGTALLGVFLTISRFRPGFGLSLMVLSVIWFVLDKFVIMRWAGTWWFANIYKELMAPGESGYGSIVKTILINPVFFVSTLLKQEKLVFFLHMFAPLAFLPFRNQALLLLAVPGFFFTLMTTGYAPTLSIAFQYTTHWVPYLFASSVLALYLLSRGEGGVLRRRAALGAMLLGVLSHSYIFGFLFHQKNFTAGFQRPDFSYTSADHKRYVEFRRLVSQIPRTAVVAATESEIPQLSNRRTAYTLRDHHGDAEYLVIAKNRLSFGNTKNTVRDAFSRNQYGLLGKTDHFYLFKIGHLSQDTEAALADLGISPGKIP